MTGPARDAVPPARQRMITTALEAFAAGKSEAFVDHRTRRALDRTWAEFGEAVRQYTTILCQHGYKRDDAIAEVMGTLLEALPDLPPYHAFRASTAGWAAAACVGRE